MKTETDWSADSTVIRGRKSLVERVYLQQHPAAAAAPELLAALRRIHNNATARKWGGESKGPDFDSFCDIEKEARAAIAKAEGR